MLGGEVELPDAAAGVVAPFDDRHLPARAEQVERGAQPGQPGADDHHVVGAPGATRLAQRRRRVAVMASSASCRGGGRGDRRGSQRVERRAGERGDPLLDGLHGAELGEDVAGAIDLLGGEPGVADRGFDGRPRGGVAAPLGALQRDGEQQRALAFAQVVARGLAGDGRVAEHAEEVVAELEGDADVGPEPAVAVDQLGPGPRQRRAEVQRPFDGVRGGLVAVDAQRRGLRRIAGGLVEDVEVLAAQQLGAHRAPRHSRPHERVLRQAARVEHVVGPHHGEVAEQDGGRGARTGRACRTSPPRRACGRTRRARSGVRAAAPRRP